MPCKRQASTKAPRSNYITACTMKYCPSLCKMCEYWLFDGDLRSIWSIQGAYERRTRSIQGDGARTVLVHLCELLPRPKVSPHSLILRGNNSAAQLSPRLNKLCGSARKIHTTLREKNLFSQVFFSPSRKGRKGEA